MVVTAFPFNGTEFVDPWFFEIVIAILAPLSQLIIILYESLLVQKEIAQSNQTKLAWYNQEENSKYYAIES